MPEETKFISARTEVNQNRYFQDAQEALQNQ